MFFTGAWKKLKCDKFQVTVAHARSWISLLWLFTISGCGVFPGKSAQEQKLSTQAIGWEQLCFSPQGRARLSQGAEKNLASVEGLFRPEEKQSAVAFSAPIYGERVFRLNWPQERLNFPAQIFRP